MEHFWLALLILHLLGAEIRIIHGTVVDGQGSPVADVCLDHYGAVYCNSKTDALGRFQIRTNAPALVFRKPLYAAQLVRVVGEDLHVVMPSAPLAAPACALPCDDGIYGSFCFPSVKGVKATKPGSDVDFTARSYVARVGEQKGAIVHGQGSAWTLGLPRDQNVWESIEYLERDYTGRYGQLIVDARGRKADGSVWRYLGVVGESASYERLTDKAVAALLDRVMDGFCVSSR